MNAFQPTIHWPYAYFTCPTHPHHGVLCTCGWYQRGRAHIIHPAP